MARSRLLLTDSSGRASVPLTSAATRSSLSPETIRQTTCSRVLSGRPAVSPAQRTRSEPMAQRPNSRSPWSAITSSLVPTPGSTRKGTPGRSIAGSRTPRARATTESRGRGPRWSSTAETWIPSMAEPRAVRVAEITVGRP